jgi:hypothetical protein
MLLTQGYKDNVTSCFHELRVRVQCVLMSYDLSDRRCRDAGSQHCSYTVTLLLLNGSITLSFRCKQPLKARTNALHDEEAFASK